MLQRIEHKVLQSPASVTGAGVTGSYVDMQGLVNEENMKAILLVGAGTTAGTAGGYLQQADDTSGTGLATVLTFDTQTSAGGSSEKHGVVTKRYVRFVGDVQTGKDMILSVVLLGGARFRP